MQNNLAYPPRLMKVERAAAYLDMGPSKFLALVKEKIMPQPIRQDGADLWDRMELDAAVDALVAARDAT